MKKTVLRRGGTSYNQSTRNSKIFKISNINMNRFFSLILIVFVLLVNFSCFSFTDSAKNSEYSKYSKENHTRTFILDKSLYIEQYKVLSGGGGATTCDIYSCYITDSVNFRKYIGEEDFCSKRIRWNYKDARNVEFYAIYSDFDEINNKPFDDTIKIGSYNISNLIKEGKFD